MKIDPQLLQHLKTTVVGRMRLKLFFEISKKRNESPNKKSIIKYIENIRKDYPTFSELFTFILTDGKHNIKSTRSLQSPNSVSELFTNLNSFPLIKPVLIILNDFLETENICCWIDCHELKDSLGHFYTTVFFTEESFPDSVVRFSEIRVSQSHPEPSLTIFSSEINEIFTKEQLVNTEDQLSILTLKLLNYISTQHIDTYVPLEKVRILEDNKIVRDVQLPEDKYLAKLLHELSLGLISCSLLEINLSEILPFDVDFCFQIPLMLIEEAEKELHKLSNGGILLYWKEGNFVMSDDYSAFLALMKKGIIQIKAVVVGEFPEQYKAIKSGGFEMLPPLLSLFRPTYNSLPSPMRLLLLNSYVKKLQVISRVKDITECKCVVFSEDNDTKYLENILISSGFSTDETLIYSYKNCTNIDSLELSIHSLKKINPDINVIVHRDRDYLLDTEIKKIEKGIKANGAETFITKGTDIEAYYLNAKHVNLLYPHLEVSTIKNIIEGIYSQLQTDTLQRIKKHEHGERYKDKETYLEHHLLRLPKTQYAKYIHGKTALGLFIGKIQTELRKNPDLIQPTRFLKDKNLTIIAKKIWK